MPQHKQAVSLSAIESHARIKLLVDLFGRSTPVYVAARQISAIWNSPRLSDAGPDEGFHGDARSDALRPPLLSAVHPSGESWILSAHALLDRGMQGSASQPLRPGAVPTLGDNLFV